MKIIDVRVATIEIEDEQRNRSTVFKQGDGTWKCLRCQRRRCEHAKFAAITNPILPETVLSEEEIADLIDE